MAGRFDPKDLEKFKDGDKYEYKSPGRGTDTDGDGKIDFDCSGFDHHVTTEIQGYDIPYLNTVALNGNLQGLAQRHYDTIADMDDLCSGGKVGAAGQREIDGIGPGDSVLFDGHMGKVVSFDPATGRGEMFHFNKKELPGNVRPFAFGTDSCDGKNQTDVYWGDDVNASGKGGSITNNSPTKVIRPKPEFAEPGTEVSAEAPAAGEFAVAFNATAPNAVNFAAEWLGEALSDDLQTACPGGDVGDDTDPSLCAPSAEKPTVGVPEVASGEMSDPDSTAQGYPSRDTAEQSSGSAEAERGNETARGEAYASPEPEETTDEERLAMYRQYADSRNAANAARKTAEAPSNAADGSDAAFDGLAAASGEADESTAAEDVPPRRESRRNGRRSIGRRRKRKAGYAGFDRRNREGGRRNSCGVGRGMRDGGNILDPPPYAVASPERKRIS